MVSRYLNSKYKHLVVDYEAVTALIYYLLLMTLYLTTPRGSFHLRLTNTSSLNQPN